MTQQDPADHARQMRESFAAKSAQLSDLVRRTDHNGRIAPPPAPPAPPELTLVPAPPQGWGSADGGPLGDTLPPAPPREPTMNEKLFAVLYADRNGRSYQDALAEVIKADPWGGDAA